MPNSVKLIFFLNLLLVFQVVKSQEKGLLSLKVKEDSLFVLMNKIYSDSPISDIEDANFKFKSILEKTLQIGGAFDYPFDSLKHLGKITSSDNQVRIFTWNLPQNGGLQKYFGYILFKGKKGKEIKIFELNDNRKLVKDPIKDILTSDQWIGALYYSIIEKKINGKINYILLGLDFNNLFSSKKIIEVLSFGKDSQPIFGASIFKVGDLTLNRVIFEYSARASMTLRYISESNLIAFDHLSPSRPEFADDFQFYGPDFTYDGFQFEKNFWVYLRNLDIRNPKRGPLKLKESPENIQEPGFLYKSKGGLPMQINK